MAPTLRLSLRAITLVFTFSRASVFKVRTSSFVHERSFVFFAISLPYPLRPTIGRCLKTKRAPNLRRSRSFAIYHEQHMYHAAMWITVANLKRSTRHRPAKRRVFAACVRLSCTGRLGARAFADWLHSANLVAIEDKTDLPGAVWRSREARDADH